MVVVGTSFGVGKRECIYALDCDNLTTGSFGAVIGDLVFALSKGKSFYIRF